MDIRNPKTRFDDQLDRAFRGRPIDPSGLLQEEIEILHMVSAIKQVEYRSEPADAFSQNLRKRLLNTHDLMNHAASASVTKESGNLLTAGSNALLPRPRRWAWAVAPIAAVAVLAAYVSFAAASPGFYEKYVPKPVKKVLEDTKVVQTGNLQVTSIPSGATLLLNNQEQGVTPVEIGGVRVGRHNVTVRQDGFEEEQREIEIKADETTSLEFLLVSRGSDVQPTPTPSEITMQDEQVVLLSQNTESSVLQIGSTAGGATETIFKIEPAVEQISVANSGHIFFSQKQGKQTTIYRLAANGDLQIVATSDKALSEKFTVSSDGSAVSFVTGASSDYEIHLFKIGGSDQVIYNSTEQAWLPLAITGDEVIVAQTAIDRRTVKKIITVKSALAQPLEWVLPSGTNILLDSQSAYQAAEGAVLLQNGASLVAVKPSASPVDVFQGEANYAAWAGSRVLVVAENKVKLIDLKNNQVQEVYSAPNGLTIKKLISDKKGREIVVWLSDNRLEAISLADLTSQTLYSSLAVEACLAVVDANTFTASGAVINTKESTPAPALYPAGQLELSSAPSEAMAIFGNNILRASDGEKSLEVISLADASRPKVIGSLPRTNFSGDITVASSGRYAVVAGGKLQFIDLVNPGAPKVTFEEAVPAVAVVAVADKAYAIADGKLLVYSLAADKIKKIGETDLGVSQALALAVKNNRLFIAAGDEGLVVVDISQSAKPSVLQRVRDNFVREVAPAGKYMYVFTGNPGSTGQTEVWEVSVPQALKTISPAVALNQVFGAGNFLYATAPKLSVFESVADGELQTKAEAESSGLSAADTLILAIDRNVVTLNEGKLKIYQIVK